jgi:hypothetical protein
MYSLGSGYAFCRESSGLTEAHKTAIMLGRAIEPPLPTLRVAELTPGELGDTIGTAWSSLLVNETIRTQLPESIIQFIPVALPLPLDTLPYFIANFLELHRGIDYQRSEYELVEGSDHDIDRLKLLHLRFESADLPPVFRLAELPFVTLIHTDLRAKLEAASPSPGVFIAPQEYSFGF